MCVTIHIPVLIAIYMYISDKLFIFVKFSWIKLAKFMIKQYHKCNCSKLIVNSLTNLCESPSSSSSGIEQESLPTVSSSVNLHVSGTHRCSPLDYIHLKRSLFLQLKLYTWGPCLATGGANHKVSPKLLDGSCGNCAGW